MIKEYLKMAALVLGGLALLYIIGWVLSGDTSSPSITFEDRSTISKK